MKRSKKILFIIPASVVSVFIITLIVYAFFVPSRTLRVGGMIAFVRSDSIIDISEDEFLTLAKESSYDEIVSKMGKPSGQVGSGIVRDYWRIGENKYGVVNYFGSKTRGIPEIWTGEQSKKKNGF